MKTKKEILLIEEQPYKRPPRLFGAILTFIVLLGLFLTGMLIYGVVYMVFSLFR